MGFRSTGFREETGLPSPTQPTVATKRSDAGTANRTGRRRNYHRPLESHTLIHRLVIMTGEYFMHQRKLSVLVFGLLTVAAIGELDLLSGPDISLSLFYILPIAIVTWRIGRTAGFALSVL